MTLSPYRKALVAASLAATLTSSSQAAVFAGIANGIDFSYTGYQSAFLIEVGTNDLPGLEEGGLYYALCLDFNKQSYWEENGNSDVVNYPINEQVFTDLGISAAFDDSPAQDEAVVIAQLGYLVDNYFEDKFVNGNSTERAAFAQVVWEIAYDGGRTASAANDLDLRAGDFSRNTTQSGGAFNNGTTLFNEMSAMLSAVETENPQTHTWVTENYLVFQDNATEQDYMLLRIAPIPEPSTALVSLLGMGLLIRRRR